ncbi:hypothetical protein BDQ17DRAFT_1539318 [Cyathus striatus]|nr:hypothetical protein BDQ17DRAFT_1539318 [Cyathus striatus]
MSNPTYIYKIVPYTSPPPDPLPEKLPLSDLDRTSGFIHLSTATQVAGTLKHFFANDPAAYILKIDYHNVERQIRWEDPKAEVCGNRRDEGLFPHLYNDGKLGKTEVESVLLMERNENGWDDALEKARNWLLD